MEIGRRKFWFAWIKLSRLVSKTVEYLFDPYTSCFPTLLSWALMMSFPNINVKNIALFRFGCSSCFWG